MRGRFTHRQERSEVPWSDVPADFCEFSPGKKRHEIVKQALT